MNLTEPPLNPPPFSFYEDPAFAADMSMIVPDERVRDDVVNAVGWEITHSLVGGYSASGITPVSGTDYSLIVTRKTGICPALRILYSVEDEPPKRRINFHRGSLRDQNGSAGH